MSGGAQPDEAEARSPRRLRTATRRRPTGRPIRSLDPTGQRLVVLALVALALAPLVAAGLARQEGWTPTGDVAVIGLRSLDAWTGDSPLVGQPATAEEVTGVPTFHPGPFQYWWTGPWVGLLGPAAGLLVATALVNGAALAGSAWLAFRRGGPPLLALTALTLVLLIRGLGAASLYDPFNPELATYPMVLAVLATWSVLARDPRALPVLLGAATVAGHTHLASAGFVAPLVILAVGSLLRQASRDPGLVRRHRTPLGVAAGIATAAVLPPLLQETSSGPSNLDALWRYATTDNARIGVAFALERLAGAVTVPPLFVRQAGRYGFLDDPGTLGIIIGALVLAGWASLALLARLRAERVDPLRLAAVLGVAVVVSLVTSSGLAPLSAFRADSTRWLWVVGSLLWLSAAWSGWQLLPLALRRRAGRLAPGLAVAIIVVGLVASIGTDQLRTQRDGRVMAAAQEVADSTADRLADGTYLLTYDGPQAITFGPTVALTLLDRGIALVVPAGPFDRGYGPDRVHRDQPLDGTLRVATGDDPVARAGEEQLARAPLSAAAPERGTVAVFLSR